MKFKARKWYRKEYPREHDWYGIVAFFMPISFGEKTVTSHIIYDEELPNEYNQRDAIGQFFEYDEDVEELEQRDFQELVRAIFK